MDDTLGQLLMQMPTPTLLTYGLTGAIGKGISRLRHIPQATLAVPIGALTGVGCYALGWIDPGAAGVAGWAAAGGLGLAAAVIAGQTHDKLVKPLMPAKVKAAIAKKKNGQ